VSVGYAVVAALWIILSDSALLFLGFDVTSSTLLSLLKGLLFVFVTASVLYVLTTRFSRGIESSAYSLLSTEIRYRDLVQSVSDIVWEADAEGRFTFVSARCSSVLGRRPQEMIGLSPLVLAPAEERDKLAASLASMGHAEPPFELLWSRAVCPDGRIVVLESNILPVFGSDGALEGYRGVTRDVTERERLARAVRETSEFLAALIRVAPVPIIALDEDRKITVWNPAAAEVFGWSADEVLGGPNPIIPSGSHDEYASILGRVAAGKTIRGIEGTRRTRDGRELHVRLFAAPLMEAGRSTGGTMAVLQDVTDERRVDAELVRYREHLQELVDERTEELRHVNDELREATEAKSAFLANMSHELRTPLNAIIGFTGILLNGLAGPVNEEQHKQLAMAHSAGERLLELINDVLDLSKIEAGRAEVRPESTCVSAIVDHVAGAIESLATGKGLAWLLEVEDPGQEIFTDPRRVEQVLLNLLGNAVKFTETGSVKLAVTTDGDRIHFRVIDTGPGIALERQQDIFDEFVQVQTRDEVLTEGTGLGLSIARRLAILLRGWLTVESAPGLGSTFTLELPVDLRDVAVGGEMTTTTRVMVVHGDPEFVELCEYVMRPMGYRVLWVPTVTAALDGLANSRPAMAIVDGAMALPGGGDLANRIAGDDHGPRIPVIRAGAPVAGDRAVAVVGHVVNAEEIAAAVRVAGTLMDMGDRETS
jgi:PAS domain S-box-containing protein